MKLLRELLRELVEPNSMALTNMQMGALVNIKLSPTPEVAYENTVGSMKTVHARNVLKLLGLVTIGTNSVGLTPKGEQVLNNYNLFDEAGNLTERGNDVKASYDVELAAPSSNS